jgi:hypothetical protein
MESVLICFTKIDYVENRDLSENVDYYVVNAAI